jgi:photosystem II stability/assembly factor-like uncharacterized protein
MKGQAFQRSLLLLMARFRIQGAKMNRVTICFVLAFLASGLFSCSKPGSPSGPVNPVWILNQDLPSISAIGVSGNNLVAASPELSEVSLYLSTDNGSSWEMTNKIPVNNHDINNPLFLIPSTALLIDGASIFVGVGGYTGSVLVSTDNGINWTEKDHGFTEVVNSFALIGGTIFAGTNKGLFHSTNGGMGWIADNAAMSYPITQLTVYGSNLLAGTTFNGIYRFTKNGTSWSAVNSGFSENSIYGLSVIGSNIFADVFKSTADSANGVYISTDGGNNWNESSVKSQKNMLVGLLYASGSKLFVGTNVGVFLSVNSGETWVDITAGTAIDSLGTMALTVNDMYLFAGTNGSNGVWRYPLSQLPAEIKSNKN